ncbi:MAG TPA: divalent metal cation transporter [Bryobacteraceae bacterium]|jgi:NRAMP (natural resistance-associated macrophage protein)-like metal ion transporter|nr:divalent metal cation transporter [Bryobacteraceae bacterium]
MKKQRDRNRTLNGVRAFFSKLGPGLVTGASDDDPSGIGTYSIAGAQLGYSPLWTAWFLLPLMAAVQLMCARLGMVSGRGMAGLLRTRYGPWALWPSCFLLVVANVVNIGADLGAMAAAAGMVTGLQPYLFTPLFTGGILALMACWPYRRIAQVLKWMTLVLFAYVIAGFRAHPNWGSVLRATFVPHLEFSASYLNMFVAIAGTTISPYLFFWQAAQEVEEDREKGKTTVAERKGATDAETRDSRVDVMTGIVFSQLIMYFIILTAAATLNAHGQTNIATTEQAAEALRPFAGDATYLLFTLGIVGTGMLCVPVLAGSTAFAIAEGAGWSHSLRYRPRQARAFYGVLTGALLLGMAMNYFGLRVVSMLFWSAVINGLLAPPLLVLVVLLSSDPRVMGKRVSSPTLQIFGWLAAFVMGAAAIAMIVTGWGSGA